MYNTKRIKELIDALPSNNIYELLYLNDIDIIESNKLINKKLESQIVIVNKEAGIYIKPNLDEMYKQFLLRHEFAHYLLHYEEDKHYNFYLSRFKNKSELEANLFSVISLLKDLDIYEDTNVLELLINNGVPEQIAIQTFEALKL
ncbi:MAG: ImmA/IrrE family metallo-endopeptidase [Erysipelotrichaceae bacterium]|nr:ImmA/IrrE family metallo-endopeptidase [Erysipelotrichaceae bacterium]